MKKRHCKIVILGDQSVGKSAIVKQFVFNIFPKDYDPTIEDLYHKKIIIDHYEYNIDLLDTAGSEQFAAIRDLYIKESDGFILVYSITSVSSFNQLNDLIDSIIDIKKTNKILINDERHKLPCVIVGNKIDLNRVVSEKIVSNLAKKYEIKYTEISAKTSLRVNEIFISILEQINDNCNICKTHKKSTKKCIIL